VNDWYNLDVPAVLEKLGTDASRGLSADLSARRAIGSGSVAISGIEDIQGSPFGDSLRGNSLVNRLEGGGGADTLSGGGGEDVALGGAGNDILYGTPGGDVLRGGTGRDRCQMAPGVTRIDCERNTFGPDPILTTNTYRGMGDLPPLLENRTFSRGDWLHSRWMVKNDRIAHDEEPGTPFYTRAGDAAGNSGNIAVNTSASVPDTLAVDLWMEGPFHALGILRPSLHQTGFGAYRDGAGSFRFGATLDVIRGIGRIPGSVRFPILFPGPGTTTPIRLYGGTEFPDPLTACPRTFDAPSGPPIMAQLATNPRVRSFSVKTGGRALPACEFDETNYDGEAAGLARAILDGANAVVILPKDPLQRGKRYTVSFTSSGRTIRWSFSA
jgi:hypothetical protein